MLMKDFISYELAKKLEKKGFDCDNNYGYNEKGDICVPVYNIDEDQLRTMTPCPEIHEVLKWLREKHKLHIDIAIWDGQYIAMIVHINVKDENIEHSNETVCMENDDKYDSYEQAAIAGIEYVIDNLI